MEQQTIREVINKEREKRGETINALAEQIFAAGIMSRCMVNLWLSGRNNVSDDKASKVMAMLGITIKPKRRGKLANTGAK